MFIFDAHLDLAMNAMEWNRDLCQSIEEIRHSENGMTDKLDRGKGTVCFEEMRRGSIGLCVATQIARVDHGAFSPLPGWRSPSQAWAQTQAQRAWYIAMEEAGELTPIRSAESLQAHLRLWMQEGDATNDNSKKPIGYILSLEGADSIVHLDYLERAYEYGLRAIGPAHYGPGRYAQGTNTTGGFNAAGKELLREMDRLGFILDVTHLSDECFFEAMESYEGPVWASHSNCRALVPGQRQFADEQIRLLIERDAVMGGVLDCWMLTPGWVRKESTPAEMGVTLESVVDHMDHICQVAGNTRHCGIGTDLDGGFGREQSPADLNTIADIQSLSSILAQRGFSEEDTANICHANFIRLLMNA